MKIKLHEHGPKLLCVVLLVAGTAMPARSGDGVTNKAPGVAMAQAPGQPPAPVHKAGEWKDPDKVLPLVKYEGLPIVEVGTILKEQFKDAFDVLYPYGDQSFQWDQTQIVLQLKNVKASEIFNAMNMVFETAGTPLRWELLMNGARPTALLRDLHTPALIDANTGLPVPGAFPTPLPEKPMVFFVGDLLGDPKSGGMTMDQLVKTVEEVCKFGGANVRLFTHKEAQLLVTRGTEEDFRFVESALKALRQKTILEENRRRERAKLSP